MLSIPHFPRLVSLAATILFTALLTVAPPAAGESPPARQELELTPCGANIEGGALCGTHRVPENPTRPDGRMLELRVGVLPATGPDARPDPVFYLPGGPGAPATPAASGLASHPARRMHDLVFVDVRGTSGAHALSCDTELVEVRDRLEIFARPEVHAACRDRLAREADLTQYSTPRMVDDFESVRRALGYGPINLLGTSGGTRTALVYLRRYPASVRTAVLMGVAPTSFRNPLHHARSAQDALDRLLDLCGARPACAAAYPDLRDDLARTVARLRETPADVEVPHPDTGEAVRLRFDGVLLGESVRQLMYSSSRGARVPALLQRAARGDLRPLAELAVARSVGGNISIGLLNSIVCSEDASRIGESDVERETADTLLGDRRVRQQLAVCALWPRTDIDPAYGEPVAADHPVLLLSGSLDPVTPPAKADDAAEHLPNGLHVTVEGGHGIFGPCVNGIVADFLERGTTEGLDTGCAATVRYPEFEVLEGGSQDDLPPAIAQVLPSAWGNLREALSIPNDAHFPEHVAANVAWAERVFAARGFATRELDTGGPPLLLAERTSPGASRTTLVYLQIDGQPVDPAAWQQEDPYTPVLMERSSDGWSEISWESLEAGFDPEWRVFARSASDAKGPVVAFLAALDVLAATDAAPTTNLRVIMDFEEELGSPHLPPAVDVHREALDADWLLIFDGPRHPSNEPTLTFGARGIATVTLTVFGPRAPQHSGHYGNYAPNPAVRLAQLIASMKDDEGRVTLTGFYDGVELSDEVRAILARTPDDEAQIREQIGVAAPDGVGGSYQEAIQYPSLNVRGMASGWVGEQARTIVPATATAEIDVRLVSESDPEHLIGLIRGHVVAQGYHLIGDREPTEQERAEQPRIASFTHTVSYRAFRTPLDSPVGLWLRSALTRTFGAEPILIRTSGGSIPISPFVDQLGLPAVTVPTVNRDNNQHSPNENLRLGNFVEAIETFLGILTEPVE